MKWFLGYIWKQKKFYIGGAILLVLMIAADFVTPYLTKIIIDDVITQGKISIFIPLLVAIFSITVLRFVFGYIKNLLLDKAGVSVVSHMREDVFIHLQKLPFTYFDKVNTGELLARVKEDAESIQEVATFSAMLTIEQLINFVFAIIVLAMIHYKLMLVTVLIAPLIMYIAIKYEKDDFEIEDQFSDQKASLNIVAQENLVGIRVVKSLAREKHEIKKMKRENKKLYKIYLKSARVEGKYEPLIEFLSNLTVVSTILYGGFLVIRENITIGDLVASVQYVYMIIWPMRMLGWLMSLTAIAKVSIDKLSKIVEEHFEETGESEVYGEDVRIVFDHVDYKIHDKYILRNICFEIKKGDTLALMGTSGAGKTTIVNLLCKNYKPTSGKILINGVDIQKLDTRKLRELISVTMQNTFLFSASIKDNIALGIQGEMKQEKLEDVMEESRVTEFLHELPQKENTVIGERGLGLSGGQKQRVSIARALVKPSKILILDDVTSALDTNTEEEIHKSLRERQEQIKIIVAHRISAVRKATKILLLNQGEVIEQGTHQELLSLDGMYAEIDRQQNENIMEESM